MASKRTTPICGTRGILNVKPGGSSTSVRTEKTVTIVEPTSVREKRLEKEKQRIEKYKEKVNDLIYEQIQKRKEEFAKLKANADFQRTWSRVKRWILWLFLVWLLLSMVMASLCHAHNTHCQVFWYESVLAAVFRCFVTSWRDRQPVF